MFENILIATDGSEQSEASVSKGLDLAESLGSHVHSVYVVETEATYILTVGLGDDEMEEYKQYGEETVTGVVDRAADRGLDGTGVVRTGNVAAEIVEYAENNDIDLIVTGKQGRGAISKYIGSTAEKVARMSDVPVTIVGKGAK
ncbi:universal stress protein UspA [Halorubrum sp. Ib24]|uniref:universal stress protein n=1 Tax=unclassified Halorubrum TaxID=2642239 RepID=UPI000B998D1C|nr:MULTISPECIES: universal stress protein [unclassified Halorubrum]OYR42959.1 universal stress protein UspA [Halorubrum sp. Ib24]OYR43534.1 universal stress protein UspA [Halorubrum sp. Hd13]OYR44902.1 universal stress protein UspA [Halorubrum sp. Ea8]OYR47269.1 universal stress protein UspA [Halorubrum sp. Eb13]OYR55064.1 universal stress protein UspA [Halorubrum sp. Ea1]